MAKTNYFAGLLENIEIVVIFTKYQDKWVYCWHKYRKSYEHPGGHVEPNETPLSEMERIDLFDTVPENYTYDVEEEKADLETISKMLTNCFSEIYPR